MYINNIVYANLTEGSPQLGKSRIFITYTVSIVRLIDYMIVLVKTTAN